MNEWNALRLTYEKWQNFLKTGLSLPPIFQMLDHSVDFIASVNKEFSSIQFEVCSEHHLAISG